MILINVLIIVMLTTAVLAIILAGEQGDVERTSGLRFAAQAQSTARGAELSAVVALRRDLARDGQTDSLHDEWATIGDREAKIPGGRFSFAISDAQSRFNVNDLTRGDVTSRETFARIADTAGLRTDVVDRIVAMLAVGGALNDLKDLRIAGLGDVDLQRLAQTCTALPQATDVNLNTAPESLLTDLFGDKTIARKLVAMRARDGLTIDRMQAAGMLLPPGTALNSSFYWARGRVTIEDTSQQLTSLLYRHVAKGKPSVLAIRRWRGAAPVEAPPLR